VNGKEIINSIRSNGRHILNEIESKQVIKEAGLHVVNTDLAKTKDEAISISNRFGFPVAMKIISPEIIHKSDSGGIKLNIRTSEEVAKSYDDILCNIRKKYPDAKIEGFSIQNMASPGVEIVVGMFKDEQFGPVLMFGLGGIFVEILEDVSFRIVPLTQKDALLMIQEIKGYKLLKGFRGMEAVDVSKLEELLIKMSDFVQYYPEIKEIDLNPVFAYKDCYLIVDARIILHNE
jgi:acetyl-CoA synthetase (ADP-forming)